MVSHTSVDIEAKNCSVGVGNHAEAAVHEIDDAKAAEVAEAAEAAGDMVAAAVDSSLLRMKG